ncbi:5873_t:CDS:2 [Scutellospora calospora]|uniref:5873_t:CDS:1 n=1 Tax=Scutellospora calospora TaxID=85575 RepID=A0ACA9LP22_9GLOM|nr:5873_t:CDS:2 [Scutellospora calospora]
MPPVPPPDDQPTKPKSALDIVVNQLVRASVGGNIPSSLSDDDLDKYVADLIMKEASAKNNLYSKEGLRAYLPDTGTAPCNLPKTNKRFLLNVIKSVDGHNQALVKKSEEDAAAAQVLEGINQGMPTILVVVDTVILITVKKKFLGQEGEEVDIEITKVDESKCDENNNDMDNCDMSNSDMSISPISMSPKINFCSASELVKSNPPAPIIRKKGRGEVSDGSKMDKYFEKDYDPMYDFERFSWLNYVAVNKKVSTKTEDLPILPIISEEVEKVEKKKKKKRHKEKSKKHRKSRKSKKKPKDEVVREWDMPKLTGCWDLESLTKTKTDAIYDGVREWDKPKLASGSWDPESVRSKDDEKKSVYDGVREWDKPKLASGSWDPEDSSE